MSWTLYKASRVMRNSQGSALKLTPNETNLIVAVVENHDLNKATVRANSSSGSSRGRVALSRLRSKFLKKGLNIPFHSMYGTQQYKLIERIELR